MNDPADSAAHLPSAGAPATKQQLLVCMLAEQAYGLPLTSVREVLPLAALVSLPEMPAGLAGILRLRGTLLPIVSLRQCLGLAPAAPDLRQRIVVTLIAAIPIGLLVDAVSGLLSVGEAVEEVEGRIVQRVLETPAGALIVLAPGALVGAELLHFIQATLMAGAEAVPSMPSAEASL